MKYYFKIIREGSDFIQVIGPFSNYGLAVTVREKMRGSGAQVSQIASSEN
jgi:hypothetical protein